MALDFGFEFVCQCTDEFEQRSASSLAKSGASCDRKKFPLPEDRNSFKLRQQIVSRMERLKFPSYLRDEDVAHPDLDYRLLFGCRGFQLSGPVNQ